MTDMFISIDGEATLGTKCPTHKLEIKKMNEIEKTEGEIKVLQAKLELLKEMEKHKPPCEKAFKRVYGYYQEVCERSVWIAFKKGYDASKEDCKVEEEPKPTPETLYDIVRHTVGYSIDCCDEILDAVEEWLPDELEYGDVGGAYERGWNAAIRTTKDNLR